MWSNAPRDRAFRRLAPVAAGKPGDGRRAWPTTIENLYVAMECFDPNPAEISTAMPEADQYRLCDSVEVLVAPQGTKSGQFTHWIVDSQGTVFDARAEKASDGQIQYIGQVERRRAGKGVACRRPLDGRAGDSAGRTSASGWSRAPRLEFCCAGTSSTLDRQASTNRTRACSSTATSSRPWRNLQRSVSRKMRIVTPRLAKWRSRYAR